MDLITTELMKYKRRCDELSRDCHLFQTEVQLMNKLLELEQKFSKHLTLLLFESQIVARDQVKEWARHRAVIEKKECHLIDLRRDLRTWRQRNRPLNDDGLRRDHTYANASKGEPSAEKPLQKKKASAEQPLPTLRPITRDNVINKTPIVDLDIQVLSDEPEVQILTDEPEVSPEASTSNEKSSEPSVQMEIIPKSEPMSGEETDSASECGVDVGPSVAPAVKDRPFLFVSEFLSKNSAFSHLLKKAQTEQTEVEEDVKPAIDEIAINKSIAIDLNSDSDGPEPQKTPGPEPVDDNSIFDNDIIDLTPKTSSKKSSPKTGNKIGSKTRSKKYKKKKKIIKTKGKAANGPTVSSKKIVSSKSDPNPSLTITEVAENSTKKLRKDSKQSADKMTTERHINDNKTHISELNEKLVKSNRKIALKGKTYYCKYNKCKYKTESRQSMIRHSWRHTGERPYKCTVCSLGFRETRQLKRHLMAHNAVKQTATSRERPGIFRKRGSGDVLCPECEHRYYTFRALLRHMQRKHGLQKALKYKKQYNKQKSLLESNSKKSSVAEKTCSPVAAGPKAPADKSSPAKDPVKGKAVSLPKASKAPKQAIKGKVDKKTALLNRRNIVWNKVKEWKCDFNCCERSYFDKHNLKRHQIEIHKRLSKAVFASLVNSKDLKFFNPKTSSRRRTRTAVAEVPETAASDESAEAKDVAMEGTADLLAESDKKFVCNYKNCSNAYLTISGLYKHKKTKHKSKVTFTKVSKISKKISTFQSAGEPTDTTQTNTADAVDNNKPSLTRQWACEVAGCGARYTWKQTLRKHLVDKHNLLNTSEQPVGAKGQAEGEEGSDADDDNVYECPYDNCHHKTLSNRTMITHYRTHFTAEDKPFKCLITGCHYSSKFLSKLKNHVLNRHSEQQFFRAMEATGVHYPAWY